MIRHFVVILAVLLANLTGKYCNKFSITNDALDRNSQHQRCQNHGNQVLLCDTLDAALRKKNEWTGFNQIILKDTTLDCHDCKLQRIVEWKNQPSHSLIGRCRLSENQLLNLQLLRKSDLRCRKIDSEDYLRLHRSKRAGTIAAACDFRSNFCKFSQEKSSDDLDWARVSGTKHDGTTGHYAYLASSQSLSNHFAQLLSPVVELPNNVQEFRVLMYFKLYGSGVDELAIFSGLYTNQYKDVWLTTTKSSASSWRKADFHFTPRQRRTRIILDGVLGRGHGGQIEVDYILIAPYEVNCYTGNGVYYRGSITKTISGYNCQQWKSNSPHNHSYSPSKYPDDDLSYNYCRNPGGKSSRPWCYTTNSQKVSEYCNIPSCYGGSTTTSYPLRTTTKSLGTQMQITESVQLSNYLSGVVEIKAHGVWGYMCAENLSNNTANVLCRQMGYYVSSRHYPGSPLNPQSSYQVASYNCTGLESSIEHCPSLRNTNGSYICNNPQSVAVVACEQSSGNTTSCKFDKGFCGWSQPQRNLRMDWTWQSNYIFPGTNFKKSDPSIVVSTRNGFYLDKAILRSPQQSFQSSIVTIRFKYYLSSSGSVLTLKVDENNKIIKKMSHDTNGAWISVYTEVLPSVKTFTISFVVMKTSSESVIVALDDISIVGITPEPFVRKCIRATVATALILGCILLMICQICKKKPLRTIAVENPPTYDQIVPPEDESPTEHDIIPNELTTNRINDNMEREQVRSCPRNGTADRSIISPNTVRSRESLTAEV